MGRDEKGERKKEAERERRRESEKMEIYLSVT